MAHSYHVLINKSSGTVIDMGLATIEKLINESGLSIQSLDILEPEAFFEKVESLKDSEHPILIGGGDGTIRSCAKIMLNAKGVFGVLPLGTMNLMTHDLNIPVDLKDALFAYSKKVKKTDIDVGMVNDELFLCCVGIGTMPESSEFREENRVQNPAILVPRLTVFVLNQMDRMRHRLMYLSMDGKHKRVRTAALVISNNQYEPQKEWSDNNFKRISLDHGDLGIYSAAPMTLWDRIRIIMRLRFGNWRDDPRVKRWKAETVSLVTKRDEELISLDGETQTFKTPLNFWVERKALKMLVPILEES